MAPEKEVTPEVVAEEPCDNDAGRALIIAEKNGEVTPLDQQVAELSEQLAEAKDKHNETIFYFILVLVIVFSSFAFSQITSTLGIAILGFFECLLLLGFASRLGVEGPVVLLTRLVKAIIGRLERDKVD